MISQCEKLGVIISEDLKDVADTLTLWESTSRYDPFISFSKKKYSIAKTSYSGISETLAQELSACETQQENETPDFEISM